MNNKSRKHEYQKFKLVLRMKWALNNHEHSNTQLIPMHYRMKKLKAILRKLYSILKRMHPTFTSAKSAFIFLTLSL
jgi:hypothetical protein